MKFNLRIILFFICALMASPPAFANGLDFSDSQGYFGIPKDNLGIGSSAPGQKLDVLGTIRTTGFALTTTPTSGFVLTSDGSGNGTWQAASAGSNYWLNDTGNVGIGTSYNVGIGTISQINALNILGNIGIGTFSYDPYMRNVAPKGGMIISGNVGIGTWLPGSSLEVDSSGPAIVGTTTSGGAGIAGVYGISNNTSDGVIGQNTNFGIGVYGESTSGYGVEAQTTGADAALFATSFSDAPSGIFLSGDATALSPTLLTVQFSTSTADLFQAQNTGNTPLVNITSTGNVGIGTWITKGALDIKNGNNVLVESGNVGIGSIKPGQLLDVQGTVRMTGFNITSGAGAGKVLTSDVNGNGTWGAATGSNYWLNDTGNVGIGTSYNVGIGTISQINTLNILGNIGIGTFSYDPYMITAAPNGGMIISGNVGIGSVTPGQKLDVKGAVRATGEIINGNVGIGTSLESAGLSVMNGNVGIGTWNPAAQLDIEGTLSSAIFRGNVGIGTSYFSSGALASSLNVYEQPNGAINVYGVTGNNFGNVDINLLSASLSGDWDFAVQNSTGDWDVYDNINAKTPFSIQPNTSTNTLVLTSPGNVGIGSASPGAMLDVSGAIRSTVAGNSYFAGNVGIGSISPGTILDVTGMARMTGFTLTGNGVASGNVLVTNGVGVGTWMPASTLGASGSSQWTTINTQDVYLPNNGNVGIGTTKTTTAALTVMNGNVGIGTWGPQAVSLNVVGGNVGIGTSLNNHAMLEITGNGSKELFRANPNGQNSTIPVIINSLGYVGIGTTAPDNPLHIFNGEIHMQNSTFNDLIEYLDSSGLHMISNGGYFDFATNPGAGNTVGGTSRLNIQNGGNVGIGSTNPGQVLDVQGTVRMIGFNIAAGAGAGKVLTSDVNGNGTWSAATGSNYWLNDTGNVGIGTSYNVGIGTISQINSMNILGNVGIGTFSYDPYMKTKAPNGGMIISGNVGIGTWVPSAAIEVGPYGLTAGAPSQIYFANASNTNGYPQFIGQWNSVGAWGIGPATVAGDSNLEIGPTSDTPGQTWGGGGGVNLVIPNGNIGIGTLLTSTSALTVMNGNVGIGTWIPSSLLNVNGDSILGAMDINTDTIVSNGSGSLAGGYGQHGFGFFGNITSSGTGSFAFGNSSGTIEATNDGSVAMGQSTFGGIVESTNIGSFAMGLANPSSTVESTGQGSIAMGWANGGTLGATGNASVAIGQNVQATNNNAFALGLNVVNPTASSFMVGFNPTPTLTVTGTNVGIGTWSPFGGGLIVTNGNVGIGSLIPGTLLDVQGTARMTGFTLTGNGAANGNVMVSNSVGVGTWMAATTLPVATVTTETTGDVTYYSAANTFAGGPGFQTNGTNVGIGTSGFTNASLEVVGNIGIGTVKNGDAFVTTAPPNGGMIVEGNVGIGTWVPAAPFQVNGSSGQNFYVALNGNVGIGTVNPQGALQIKTVAATSSINAWIESTKDSLLILKSDDVGGGNEWDLSSTGSDAFGGAGNFQIARSGNPQFTILSTGNVGIGTFTPEGGLTVMTGNVGIGTWVPGYPLTVNQGGNSSTNDAMQLNNNGDEGTSLELNNIAAFGRSWDVTSAAGGNVVPGSFSIELHAGDPFFAIDSNGNVGIGGAITSSTFAGAKMAIVNGNVGIGSINPGQLLDVQGSLRILGGGSVGIGTTFISGAGEAALTVMGGNVGVGTWVPGSSLQVNNTITFQSENNIGSQGGAFTVNWTQGNKEKVTLTGSVAHTATFTAPTSGVTNLVLKVVQGSASNTVTWPAAVKWPSASTPVLTTTNGQEDLVTCYWDGTDYLCTAALNYTP